MDYTKTNIATLYLFQNFFPVFKSFTFDNNYLIYKDKKISLKQFDIKEIYYETHNLFAKHLKEDILTPEKIFSILKIYENKNTYLEHEEQFYQNFGKEEPFIDTYNNYFFNLLLNQDYLTVELQKFLMRFSNRIAIIENNIGYDNNPAFVKEVDFWNDAILKLEQYNQNESGKQNVKRKTLTNPNAIGYTEENEYSYLSQAGYTNIFLTTLLFLSIGIILGSLLFLQVIK